MRRGAPERLSFVVYSGGRCGSSTLARILEMQDGITVAHEPFNPDRFEVRFKTRTGAELRRNLEKLQREFRGLKHVYDASGWPFPRGSPLNIQLLALPFTRIVLMQRRNLLQRFVSTHLSLHSGVWADDRESHIRSLRAVAPIDIPYLQGLIQRELEFRKILSRALEGCQTPLFTLWYEDMFSPGLALQERRALLETVLDFIGVRRLSGAERVDRLLSHRRKLNDERSYRLIPNISDVNNSLGCKESGFVY